MIYQFYLPHNQLTVVTDPISDSASTVIFAPSENTALKNAGARVIWTDPNEPMALWRKSTTTTHQHSN